MTFTTAVGQDPAAVSTPPGGYTDATWYAWSPGGTADTENDVAKATVFAEIPGPVTWYCVTPGTDCQESSTVPG
jgi:hypothetical protein